MADAIEPHSDSHTPGFDDSMPAGGHALEVAARAGFGPLSQLAQEVWHGQGIPCVSCGQLVHRESAACEHCGQDLGEEMIQKMRQHAGPWFVLEHVRPFPGVSLERVIRQIRRGLITETSIVRGPSNDYQWRFAVETPGLCRYFGKCWCCHGSVTLSDSYCPRCLHYLSFEKPRPGSQAPGSPESGPALGVHSAAGVASGSSGVQPSVTVQHVAQAVAMGSPSRNLEPVRTATGQGPARPHAVHPAAPVRPPGGAGSPVSPASNPAVAVTQQSPDLARLSAAVRQTRVTHRDAEWDGPRVGGVNVGWIAALVIVAAIVALLIISRARSVPAPQPSPSLPVMPAPAPQQGETPGVQPPPAPPASAISLPGKPAELPPALPPENSP